MRDFLIQQGISVELDWQGKDTTEQRYSNRVDWTKKLVVKTEGKMKVGVNKAEKILKKNCKV